MALLSRLGRLLRPGHLGDDELLELLIPALSAAQPRAAQAHLDRCDACRDRSVQLQTFLTGLTDTNEPCLAGAFPLDRLATQRERIMRRLRRTIEPAKVGRVLTFPALARPALANVHRARRWLAAAAAAGLLVGVSVGQFLHFHPEPAMSAQDTSVDTPITTSEPRRPSTASVAEPALEYEDAFLDELELVLSSPQVPQLSLLDELTPRVREGAVNIW